MWKRGGLKKNGEDLSGGASPVSRDHGSGDCFVSGRSVLADWAFCHQPGDACSGNNSTADYQCRFSGVFGFCHILGSAGGIGKGRSVFDDIIAAICICDDSGIVCAQPDVWRCGGLARVLGDRGGDGGCVIYDLSQRIESIKIFLAIDSTIVIDFIMRAMENKRQAMLLG